MDITDAYGKISPGKREGIRYLFFGALTTIIGCVSYALLVHLGIDINISNILSWFCGALFAFITNKWFVFKSKLLQIKILIYELGSFFGGRAFTGILTWVLFPFLYFIGIDQTLFGINGFLAKLVTAVIEILINWAFSKYIVFIKKNKQLP